jgi:hypothetical protein
MMEVLKIYGRVCSGVVDNLWDALTDTFCNSLYYESFIPINFYSF